MITERKNPDGSITVGIIDEDETYSVAEPKDEPKAEKPKAQPKAAPKKSAKKSK